MGVVREIQSPDILHLMTSQRLVVLLFRLLTGIIQVKIQVHSKKPSNSPYHGITIMIYARHHVPLLVVRRVLHRRLVGDRQDDSATPT